MCESTVKAKYQFYKTEKSYNIIVECHILLVSMFIDYTSGSQESNRKQSQQIISGH